MKISIVQLFSSTNLFAKCKFVPHRNPNFSTFSLQHRLLFLCLSSFPLILLTVFNRMCFVFNCVQKKERKKKKNKKNKKCIAYDFCKKQFKNFWMKIISFSNYTLNDAFLGSNFHGKKKTNMVWIKINMATKNKKESNNWSHKPHHLCIPMLFSTLSYVCQSLFQHRSIECFRPTKQQSLEKSLVLLVSN